MFRNFQKPQLSFHTRGKTMGAKHPKKILLDNQYDDYKYQDKKLKGRENDCAKGNSKGKCQKYIDNLTRMRNARYDWMIDYLDPRCYSCDVSGKNHSGAIYNIDQKIISATNRLYHLYNSPKNPAPKKPSPTKTQKRNRPANIYNMLNSSPETRAKTSKRKPAVKSKPKSKTPETPITALTRAKKKLTKKLLLIGKIEKKPERTINSDQRRKIATKANTLRSLKRTIDELEHHKIKREKTRKRYAK